MFDQEDIDSDQEKELCKTYAEARNRRKESNDNYKRNKEEKIEYAMRIVRENNITSEDKLRRYITTTGTIKQVVFKMGPNYESFFKPFIRNYVLEKTQREEEHTYREMAEEYWDKASVKKEHVEWLDKWFEANNIKKEDFADKFKRVIQKEDNKKNTFAIIGDSNGGKSMWLNNLLKPYNIAKLTRDLNQSSFMWMGCLKNYAILDEEPEICRQNVETRKLVMEGAPIEVPIKNQDNGILTRKPYFITSNHELTKWVGPTDREGIENRMYQFETKAVIGRSVPEPPGRISFSDTWECLRGCQTFKETCRRKSQKKRSLEPNDKRKAKKVRVEETLMEEWEAAELE